MIQKNFIKLYEDSFSKNFDLPALSDYTSDISYTYGEMARQIARLHLLYEAAGVKKEIRWPCLARTLPTGAWAL